MLYADEAGIVSRSSKDLQRVTPAIATACSGLGLTFSEGELETMSLQSKGCGQMSFAIKQPVRYTKKNPLSLCTWAGLTALTDYSASRSSGVFRGPGRESYDTR